MPIVNDLLNLRLEEGRTHLPLANHHILRFLSKDIKKLGLWKSILDVVSCREEDPVLRRLGVSIIVAAIQNNYDAQEEVCVPHPATAYLTRFGSSLLYMMASIL